MDNLISFLEVSGFTNGPLCLASLPIGVGSAGWEHPVALAPDKQKLYAGETGKSRDFPENGAYE